MLLQFQKPVKKQYRKDLSQKGVKFISYIPENAWLVKLYGDKEEIISEDKVRSLIPYKPSYKIDPKIGDKIKSKSIIKVKVNLFELSPKVKRGLKKIWHNQEESWKEKHRNKNI